MKKILLYILAFVFVNTVSGQATFFVSDSSLKAMYSNIGETSLHPLRVRPAYFEELSSNTAPGLKMLVVDPTRAALGLKAWYYQDIPGGGGTVYVDSVSNNAGGDSLIVFKNGVRRAYAYPSGGTSQWTTTGSAIYYNNPVSIGKTSAPYDMLDVNKSSSGGLGGMINVTNSATSAANNAVGIGFKTASAFGSGFYTGRFYLSQDGSLNGKLQTYLYKGVTSDGDLVQTLTHRGWMALGDVTPNSNFHNPGSTSLKDSITSAGSLTLDEFATGYIFSGTTATWTLAPVSSTIGRKYILKNRGSGVLTVQRGGSDQIYTNGLVSSFTILPGASCIVSNDGTYWNVVAQGGDGPQIVAYADLTTQTATTNIVTYTTPDNGFAGIYNVSANIIIAAVSSGVLTTTIDYTDETNNARTITFYNMGSTTAGLNTTGVSSFPVAGELHVYPNTTITVTTTLTVGTATFNAGSTITYIRNGISY